ncbi:MAG: hypothetical protein RLY45_778 [Actinomycetota bacterium]|jgi:thiol-disulfide isomerase/thioredoxin
MIARALLVAAAAACSAAVLGGCSSTPPPAAALEIEIGGEGGEPTTLGAYGGTALVVNLWATWCAPCIAEMPAFDAVAATIEDGGHIAVLGVNVGDSADEALAFATDLGVGYPILTDPDGRLSAALGVTGLPATAFISPAGEVVEVHAGAYTRAELETAIAEHLVGTAP